MQRVGRNENEKWQILVKMRAPCTKNARKSVCVCVSKGNRDVARKWCTNVNQTGQKLIFHAIP